MDRQVGFRIVSPPRMDKELKTLIEEGAGEKICPMCKGKNTLIKGLCTDEIGKVFYVLGCSWGHEWKIPFSMPSLAN